VIEPILSDLLSDRCETLAISGFSVLSMNYIYISNFNILLLILFQGRMLSSDGILIIVCLNNSKVTLRRISSKEYVD
jgi:hypothetical protein